MNAILEAITSIWESFDIQISRQLGIIWSNVSWRKGNFSVDCGHIDKCFPAKDTGLTFPLPITFTEEASGKTAIRRSRLLKSQSVRKSKWPKFKKKKIDFLLTQHGEPCWVGMKKYAIVKLKQLAFFHFPVPVSYNGSNNSSVNNSGLNFNSWELKREKSSTIRSLGWFLLSLLTLINGRAYGSLVFSMANTLSASLKLHPSHSSTSNIRQIAPEQCVFLKAINGRWEVTI